MQPEYSKVRFLYRQGCAESYKIVNGIVYPEIMRILLLSDYYVWSCYYHDSVLLVLIGVSFMALQNLAHGYVFKGKPMIIQFGRNPAANKAS